MILALSDAQFGLLMQTVTLFITTMGGIWIVILQNHNKAAIALAAEESMKAAEAMKVQSKQTHDLVNGRMTEFHEAQIAETKRAIEEFKTDFMKAKAFDAGIAKAPLAPVEVKIVNGTEPKEQGKGLAP